MVLFSHNAFLLDVIFIKGYMDFILSILFNIIFIMRNMIIHQETLKKFSAFLDE